MNARLKTNPVTVPAPEQQPMTADEVTSALSHLAMPVQETLELPLFEALGRVLAADVISPIDVPPHDNSAMDGYAFAGRELVAGAALDLQVMGTALAGQA